MIGREEYAYKQYSASANLTPLASLAQAQLPWQGCQSAQQAAHSIPAQPDGAAVTLSNSNSRPQEQPNSPSSAARVLRLVLYLIPSYPFSKASSLLRKHPARRNSSYDLRCTLLVDRMAVVSAHCSLSGLVQPLLSWQISWELPVQHLPEFLHPRGQSSVSGPLPSSSLSSTAFFPYVSAEV